MRSVALLALLGATLGARAAAQSPPGPVVFPRGDVFGTLAADPKEMRSFATLLWVASDTSDTWAASVAFGESIGIVRWTLGDSSAVQLGLTGAVFAQFDLATPSNDLLNTDFLIGVPFSWRARGWSGRLRLYHQSSHLGDELLLREDPPRRVNLSFESLEVLVARDHRIWRGYAGGEILLRRDPADLAPLLGHVGLEVRLPMLGVGLGGFGRGALTLAVDVKLPQERQWRPGVSGTVGIDVQAPPASAIRSWGVRLQGYTGPVPYGQFYADDVRSVGVGIFFSWW